MAEPQPAITAEEFATWLLPQAALKLLSHMDSGSAKNSIVMRLRSGLLRAVAQTIVTKYQGKERRMDLAQVNPEFWNDAGNQIHGPGLWISGDAVMEVRHRDARPGPYASKIEVSLFQVRFDPVVLRSLAPTPQEKHKWIKAKPRDQEKESEEPEESADNDENRPDVSVADLRAWFALYQQIYGDTQSLVHAEKSGRGMFPDKKVTRDRVRKLIGKRDPGRKPKRGAD